MSTGTKRFVLHADSIALFPDACGRVLSIIAPPTVLDKIDIESKSYKSVVKLSLKDDSSVNHMLNDHQLTCSDVIIIPFGYDNFERKFVPASVASTQRCVFLNCCRTPVSEDILALYFEQLNVCNVVEQQNRADAVFTVLEENDSLDFFDNKLRARLTLSLNDDILWTEAYGCAQYGKVMSFPHGEIAASHCQFNYVRVPSLPGLNGTLALSGVPILHRILSRRYLPDEAQQKMFESLSVLEESPVTAVINGGVIEELKAVSNNSNHPAIKTLEALFELDERLRVITEIGFGIDPTARLHRGLNTALNEPYGGDGVCVHFGLGTPENTIIHLDIVCPNINIVAYNAGNNIQQVSVIEKVPSYY